MLDKCLEHIASKMVFALSAYYTYYFPHSLPFCLYSRDNSKKLWIDVNEISWSHGHNKPIRLDVIFWYFVYPFFGILYHRAKSMIV